MMIFAFVDTPASLAGYWAILFPGLIVSSAVLARIVALMRFVSIRRRLHSKNTIIAEYEPPLGLSAVEMGYLFDNRFGDNELLAGVIGLAQRDLISLHPLSGKDFSLRVNPDVKNSQAKLSGSEAAIRSFIRTYQPPVNWNAMSSRVSEYVGSQEGFEREVVNDLAERGILSTGKMFRLFRNRSIAAHIEAVSLAIVAVGWPLHLALAQSAYTGLVDAGFDQLDRAMSWAMAVPLFLIAYILMLGFVGVLSHIYYRNAGVPAGATDTLKALWPEVAGYREFVETVEYNRLLADPRLDDPSLPYCLAFGLDPGLHKLL